MGDLAGLPKAGLAILPGTTHFVAPGSGILDRHDWLLAMIPAFLDAPLPEAPRRSGATARARRTTQWAAEGVRWNLPAGSELTKA